jgi:hypothetical protein
LVQNLLAPILEQGTIKMLSTHLIFFKTLSNFANFMEESAAIEKTFDRDSFMATIK